MSSLLKKILLVQLLFAIAVTGCNDASTKAKTTTKTEMPNIVVILADDMGYGELQCLNPKRGKIKTPQLDSIAAGGKIFTDAHSGSSVCTPTRYGLMTGRYAWRTHLQARVLQGGECLIAKDRLTVAKMLKEKGYDTAMFGKWHLGMMYNGKMDPGVVPVGSKVTHGPVDFGGFDEFKGFHHAGQMNIWVENDKVAKHIEPIEMLPMLTEAAVNYIDRRKGNDKPFFLYVPWNSPHGPVVPSKEWQGKSGLNKHADFVMQTDDSYGRVIQALRDNGMLDNTLVICSADNGTSAGTSGMVGLKKKGHFSSANLRGSKADIWDGGHRVPFIAHWPKVIKAGSKSDKLVCLTDVMATAAEIVDYKLPVTAAEDSMSFLSALKGLDQHQRTDVIHHSINGFFAIRQDNYKLALCPGSGGWTAPRPSKQAWGKLKREGKPLVQLYDMDKDISERKNLAQKMPGKVRQMRKLLNKQVADGRTTEGPKQKNDFPIIINKNPDDVEKLNEARLAANAARAKEIAKTARAKATAKTGKRPNILFIIADDQSPFDLKMYNPDSILDTPVLDKLASEGIVLDGAYQMGAWAGGVCTPSRHMIMSGRSVWHIPDKPGPRFGRNPLEKDPKMVPPNLAENTMAAIFNRAGYDTMRTCKRGNSYEAANEKFTVRHDDLKRGDTDETGSAWHADRVLDYLNDRQASKDTDPFLIYYGFSHPHDPRNGKIDLLAKYGAVNHTDKNTLPKANPKQPALPISYLPAHPFHHGHPGLRDEYKVSGVWEKRDKRTIRNELGREFACSENIDIQVGRVLNKLEEMGEMDNTYIIYTSDHGIAIGRHGLQGKQNLYEHTLRVPYIVKGPGIKAGTRVQGNIFLLDTLGTLCDLAGIEPPKTVESKSFKPVLEGKKDVVRDVLYGVYCGGTKPGMRSVRKGDWKLIKYDVMDGTVRKTQLFNLEDNPDELLKEHHDPKVIKLTGNTPKANQVNLAGDPKYAGKLAEMEKLLLSEMRRNDDPYRLWNQPDDGLELTGKAIEPDNSATRVKKKKVKRNKNEKYTADWDSLKDYPVPQWFDDAKFGIFIHWGGYSVIGYRKGGTGYSEHVPKFIYAESDHYYPVMKRLFGANPPEFGYKDVLPKFKAEKWNPDQWAKLFDQAGAKYVVLTAEHHDGYALWDSDLTDWCATKVGPMRDLVGDLGIAVRKRGLKYAPSYHRERHTGFFAMDKFAIKSPPRPDIAEEIKRHPEAADLYGPFEYSDAFIADYVARWKEIQTKYRPDFMWIDDIPIFYKVEPHQQSKKFQDACAGMIADYFNAAKEWGVEVYLNNKGANPNWPVNLGCLEKDNLQMDTVGPKWENPATLGTSYGYMRYEEKNDLYKSPRQLIHLLCDVVSKNGNLLLNIGPRSDGIIPKGMQDRLLAIGRWLEVNGEAIYGTRPWEIYGEGVIKDTKKAKHAINSTGIRFTRSRDGKIVYAILLQWPEKPQLIKSLKGQKVVNVEMLGSEQKLVWSMTDAGLNVTLPSTKPCQNAFVLKITTSVASEGKLK